MRCSVVFGVTLRLLSSSSAINTTAYYQWCVIHNLRDGGRGPPATVFTTLACCSINKGSQARQSQNRDFCLPHLHSTPQLGGLLSEYCYAVWHGNTRMVWLPNGEKILICLFVLTLLINVTDRHTYIQTSHDGKGCAYAQHRVAKMAEKQFVIV